MELLPRSCAGACGRMWGSNQRKRFEDLLTHVDEDEKAKVVAEQVEVVGGCRQTYKLVDENLRQSLIQHCLWKETLDLHQWRWRYFVRNLPPQRSWFSNASRLNTISYQITKNFDQVVNICCSPLPSPQVWPYLLYLGVSSDELDEANIAKRLRIRNLASLFHFCHDWCGELTVSEFCSLYEDSTSSICLGYSDIAKTLFELYAISPPRLEEVAMKAVKKENRIAVDDLSQQVQRNDQDGFFEPETYQHDLQHLSRFGQQCLRRLKALHDRKIEKGGFFAWPGCISMDIFKNA